MAEASIEFGLVPSLADVEFIRRLGEGIGAGRFAARLTEHATSVALLLEDPKRTDRTRFLGWVGRVKRIDHAVVPPVVASESVLRPAYVAFEWVEARTLESYLEALQGEPPAPDSVAIVLQAAAGLRAAHAAGVAHGELDVRSVLLVSREGGPPAVRLVGWSPPADARLEDGMREDVRALGRVLYTAVVGSPPPSALPADGGVAPEDDPAPGGFGAFDNILMDWVEVERDLHGLGEIALDMMNGGYASVDAVIDALIPPFRALLDQAYVDFSTQLERDRGFWNEVLVHRDRERQLESKLRFVRRWLRENAVSITRIEQLEGTLSRREDGLRNLELELGMLLDRPIPPSRAPRSERLPAVAVAGPVPVADVPESTPAPRARRGEPPRTPAASRSPEALSAPPPQIASPSTPPPAAPPPAADDPPAEPAPAPESPPRKRRGRGTTRLAPVTKTGGGGLLLMLVAAALVGVVAAAWLILPLLGPKPTTAPPSPPPTAVAEPAAGPPPAPVVEPEPVVVAPAPPAVEPAPPPPAPPPPAPEGMVYVAAGAAVTGLPPAQLALALAQCKADHGDQPSAAEECVEATFADEQPGPPEPVAAFFIDVHEVAQKRYDVCRGGGKCGRLKLRWDLADQPATGVTREMAEAFCRFEGARLPTLAEWRLAARGAGDARLYPWGDTSPLEGDRHMANYGKTTPYGRMPSREDGHKFAAPVGVFESRAKSPSGVANLAGNVREWVADDRPGGQGVVAGGGWRSPGYELRVTRHEVVPLDRFGNDLGFRCARDLPSP